MADEAYESWTGKGEPPIGMVQIRLRKDMDAAVGIEREPVSARSLRWDHMGGPTDIVEFRRVADPDGP